MKLAVEGSLKEIEGNLRDVMERRERVLKNSRDSISYCSKAIVHIHTGKLKEARAEILEARKVLDQLRREVGGGGLSRYLITPEGEYVEAMTIEAIVSRKPLPKFSALDVSPEGYLMGLLDSIGEVKRLLLDSIMHAEIDKARGYFETMEGLYTILAPFAAFDNVVSGVRRKIDVARMLTEDVRGIMAEEARREALVRSMSELSDSVQARKSRSR